MLLLEAAPVSEPWGSKSRRWRNIFLSIMTKSVQTWDLFLADRACRCRTCWALLRERSHDVEQLRLALKPDPGPIGCLDEPAIDPCVVGKSAERAEHAGIGFCTPETEAGCDRERHLIAAVGKERRARPAAARQHAQGAGVLYDAIGLRRIDLDHVTIGPEAAEAHQVLNIGS